MNDESTPETIWFAHYLAKILIDGERSGGALAVCEMTAPAFFGPWHVHSREVETFYVLEGRMRVETSGESVEIGPGEAFCTPIQTPHRYGVVSSRARWLMLSAPAGFEDLVRSAGIPAEAMTLPPPGRVPDAAANEAVSMRFGVTYLEDGSPEHPMAEQ
jgi:mannose-6-phosphate isomerase-like protein (cupin superfamily)